MLISLDAPSKVFSLGEISAAIIFQRFALAFRGAKVV